MSGPVAVVSCQGLLEYDFGPAHPMSPVRIDLTWRLAAELGVFDAPDVTVIEAGLASDAEIETVHTAEYLAVVKAAGDDPCGAAFGHGLGTEDNPTFAHMHDASAHVVGASLAAARAVWSGAAAHAVNISGGLHHAMADCASGFCIYNDVAVAIRWLLGQGAQRVAYVDLDAHHGDGVQNAFYDDPRVLTISMHQAPRTLFPGTGYATETGGPHALGSAVNVPLPPGTGDAGWLRAFHAVVPELLAAFAPEIVVSQHGCDSHALDPLTDLRLTIDGQRVAHQAMHDLAHRVAGGRWLALGGGGYAITQVVPRTWTHLLAIAAHRPIAPATPTPPGWRAYVETLGARRPLTMTDGAIPTYRPWETGYDPESWLDRAVHEARKVAFPANGVVLTGF